MKIIDCIGDLCPLPVIKTKKAILEGASIIEVHVDNKISCDNVQSYARSAGYDSHVEQNNGFFSIIIQSSQNPKLESLDKVNESLVAISSNTMGFGDEKLGLSLMQAFIFAISQLDVLPKEILLYNSGVFLADEKSLILEDLRKLEKMGVNIYSCGICVEFYNLKETIAVGSITNMYTIVEKMQQARNVIRP